MKNIRKIIALLIVLLLLLPMVFACNNETADPNDTGSLNLDSSAETTGNSLEGEETGNGENQKGDEPPTKEPGKTTPTEPTVSLKVIEKVIITDNESGDEGGAPDTASDDNTQETVIERVCDTFLPVGRTYIRNSGLACDFAGTGLRFTANCEESVFVKIASDKNLYFTVYVDGVRTDERVTVKKDSSDVWICIAEDIEKGIHEIELVKQSQFTQATCQIIEVGVIGEFEEAPAARNHYIEVYGDSVTNGTNILGGGMGLRSTDATSAFAYLAAREMDADCSLIGCDGIGLAASSPDVDFLMSDIWDKAGSILFEDTPDYAFERIPDVVVIQLGIYDAEYGNDTQAYALALETLINNIRAKYGEDVPIVWLYGYHDEDNSSQSIETLNMLGGVSEKLYVCEMPLSYIANEDGGDGYNPDEKTTVELTRSLVLNLSPLFKDLDDMYGSGNGDDTANDMFDPIIKNN